MSLSQGNMLEISGSQSVACGPTVPPGNLWDMQTCWIRNSEGGRDDPAIWFLTSPLGNSYKRYGLRTIVLKCRVWQGRAVLKHIQIMEHLKIMFFMGYHELVTQNSMHFTSGKICLYYLYDVFCISKHIERIVFS